MGGGIWWTIAVDHVRIGVRASSENDAYRLFVQQMFPQTTIVDSKGVHKLPGRKMPPPQAACGIRRARDDEVADYEATRRRKVTQNASLFDRTIYDEPKTRTKETA